jgi:hypothetical protein
MKFAKLLRVTSTELPEVEEVLRCYKTSKKVLKSWPGAQDATGANDATAASRDQEFVQTLSAHLSQFIETWTARLHAFHIRCSAMEEQVSSSHPTILVSDTLNSIGVCRLCSVDACCCHLYQSAHIEAAPFISEPFHARHYRRTSLSAMHSFILCESYRYACTTQWCYEDRSCVHRLQSHAFWHTCSHPMLSCVNFL